MELVGRAVKKTFQGLGTFFGIVDSYDSSTGIFNVLYEDGEPEALDPAGVALILQPVDDELRPTEQIQGRRRGRPPKKRRRGVKRACSSADSGNSANMHFVNDSTSDGRVLGIPEKREGFLGNLTGNASFELSNECASGAGNWKEIASLEFAETPIRAEGNGKGNDFLSVEETESNVPGHILHRAAGEAEAVGSIQDRNLKETAASLLSVGIQENSTLFGDGLEGCTSSGAGEHAKLGIGNIHGNLKENASSGVVIETKISGHDFSKELKDNSLFPFVRDPAMHGSDFVANLQSAYSLVVEKIQLKDGSFDSYIKGNASLVAVEKMLGKGSGSDLEGDSNAITEENPRNESKFQSPDMKERGRRKRKLKSTQGMALRRSSRRTAATLLSPSNPVLSAEELPASHILSDEILYGLDHIEHGKQSNPPAKVELPPSSNNLDIDGLPTLDLFSVYACLRSFSTVLFLSPFALEDFVAALKYNVANSLIDSIHVTILQALKLHLESLSDEGSESASICLRSINWSFLDFITWPVYLVEYLIFRGSGLKSGFQLRHLKLLNGEYYKQLPSVKLEILRCLCDDVVEVETIRLELIRRTSSSVFEMENDRTVINESYTKRIDSMDELGSSCVTEEVDAVLDPNSDECYLCRMDGSLICCDGCPAAYHSRCVGMAKDLLPEGDWYCPECVINKHDGWLKSSKPLQGAELLGIDPHGRLYFAIGGYLLVSNSDDTEPLCYYYHKNDVGIVLKELKSSDASYNSIKNVISKHWGTFVDTTESKGQSRNQTQSAPSSSEVEIETCDLNLSSTLSPSLMQETVKTNEAVDCRKLKENSVILEDSNLANCNPSQAVRKLDSASKSQLMEMTSPLESSEGSAEMPQAATCTVVEAQETVTTHPTECNITNPVEIKVPEEICPAPPPLVINSAKGLTSQMQVEPISYINFYSFGWLASSVVQELTCKSSNGIKDDLKRPAGDVISSQLKAIAKKSMKFSWPSMQKLHLDAQLEKCGWCFPCKNSSDEDCLFNKTEKKVSSGSKVGTVGIRSKRNWKSHLFSVKHHILSIEDRLRGLLAGPWEEPHHSKQWRKNILKASDIASVKPLLLTLELNLRRVALSTDWFKSVDSAVTVGSASHLLTTSDHVSSKRGGRKQARKNNSVATSKFASTESGTYWWRGGRLSRQVFHWKVLPRLMAFKSGRQGGCRKIPGVLYPDGSELSKRCKCIAWRAAVEMSMFVPQLAYQVRELDMNIKWNDIENPQLFSPLAKESKKLARPLKKVIIRRKCIEGTEVKYLLDFGKRKTVPDLVTKHGVMLEESSDERKKFWLNESFVPLKLLKAYEEKKQAQIISKANPVLNLPEEGSKMKKPAQQKGLSQLFSRAEKISVYCCGHCSEDVIAREAVKCKICKGFFHKEHVRLCEGTIKASCTYACFKCQDNKVKTRTLKVQSGAKIIVKRLKKSGGRGATMKCRAMQSEETKVMTKSSETRERIDKTISKHCKKKQLKKRKNTAKSSEVQSGRTAIGVKIYRERSEKTKATAKNSKVKPELICVPELRRSQRSVKKVSYVPVPLQSTKLPGSKEGNEVQSKRKMSIKSKTRNSQCKGKRTQVPHAYWLQGLLWTRKACGDNGSQFQERKILSPLMPATSTLQQPVCGLCHEKYDLKLMYIACESCEDWFHGDAFGISKKNVNNLLGFKCYNCLKKKPPLCPYLRDALVDKVQSHNEINHEEGIVSFKDLSEDEKCLHMINAGPKNDYFGSIDSDGPLHKKQRTDEKCPFSRDAYVDRVQSHDERNYEEGIVPSKDLAEDEKCIHMINAARSPSKDDYLGSYGSEEPVSKKQKTHSNQASKLEEMPSIVGCFGCDDTESLPSECVGKEVGHMMTESLQDEEEDGSKDNCVNAGLLDVATTFSNSANSCMATIPS